MTTELFEWSTAPDVDDPGRILLACDVYGHSIDTSRKFLTANRDSEVAWFGARNLNGELVGYGAVFRPRPALEYWLTENKVTTDSVLELGHLMVRSDSRRSQIGSRLVDARVVKVRELGSRPFALVLEGNHGSVSCLQRHGFVNVDRFVHDGRSRHVFEHVDPQSRTEYTR